MYGRSEGGIKESIVELEAFARNAMSVVGCCERSVYVICCIVRWGCGCGAMGDLPRNVLSALRDDFDSRSLYPIPTHSRSMLSILLSLCNKYNEYGI
jgi:hypothetical protein